MASMSGSYHVYPSVWKGAEGRFGWEKAMGDAGGTGGARKRVDQGASVYTKGSGGGDRESVKSRCSAGAAVQLDIQLKTAGTIANVDSNDD
ncbi:hypothetical protein D9611_014455 [Ephemerocybe angulata]|uniref:Uncharacterized protein n=1 Tax=Ephemerocybe angulata TaxID=980116 RepID=A0A8H5AS78_9AGAR|nr:hypothetical protein D9611_014455 [Tulosesus angulatus]